ncbi:FtsW/RodA/SpoVE family cell cycle protein, partial [Vibrio sp. FNV 38]|nr:FtsW/RodA/SpoVE family cell cycle protein [Vibrio sp. FNV 38]
TNPVYAQQQTIAYGIGIGAMIVCIYLVRMLRFLKKAVWMLLPASLLLLLLPLILGREINGAKNWIDLGIVSFQPSEVVKLSLVLILSWFLSRKMFLPWFLFAIACLGLLMLQKDLGTALLYFGTAL